MNTEYCKGSATKAYTNLAYVYLNGDDENECVSTCNSLV